MSDLNSEAAEDVRAVEDVMKEILVEAGEGRNKWGPFNSAHEGYAVLLEEVEALKAHVWVNQKRRNLPAMRREAIKVAAMAFRFAVEVCDEERGRR